MQIARIGKQFWLVLSLAWPLVGLSQGGLGLGN